MILNPDVCQRLLPEKIRKKIKMPSTAKIEWVTPPYLALGSFNVLWSLTEAQITYPESPTRSNRRVKKRTFSCGVRYANKRARGIWRKGNMVYHICWVKGHKKFMDC